MFQAQITTTKAYRDIDLQVHLDGRLEHLDCEHNCKRHWDTLQS